MGDAGVGYYLGTYGIRLIVGEKAYDYWGRVRASDALTIEMRACRRLFDALLRVEKRPRLKVFTKGNQISIRIIHASATARLRQIGSRKNQIRDEAEWVEFATLRDLLGGDVGMREACFEDEKADLRFARKTALKQMAILRADPTLISKSDDGNEIVFEAQ